MVKQTQFQVLAPAADPIDVDSNAFDTPGGIQKDVTAVETQIVTADTTRKQVTVLNVGADTVWLGPTGLSDTDAPIRLKIDEGYSFELFTGDLFAICAAGDTARVVVFLGTQAP